MTEQATLDDDVEEILAQCTRKQALWVRLYLVYLNATKAAEEAGYSKKTAKQIGAENLSKPILRQAIDLAMGRRAERIDTSADWVVQELAKNHHQAKDRGEIQASNRALELIGKHHKTFTDRLEVFDPERLTDEQLRRRNEEVEGRIAALEGAEAGDSSGAEE